MQSLIKWKKFSLLPLNCQSGSNISEEELVEPLGDCAAVLIKYCIRYECVMLRWDGNKVCLENNARSRRRQFARVISPLSLQLINWIWLELLQGEGVELFPPSSQPNLSHSLSKCINRQQWLIKINLYFSAAFSSTSNLAGCHRRCPVVWQELPPVAAAQPYLNREGAPTNYSRFLTRCHLQSFPFVYLL